MNINEGVSWPRQISLRPNFTYPIRIFYIILLGIILTSGKLISKFIHLKITNKKITYQTYFLLEILKDLNIYIGVKLYGGKATKSTLQSRKGHNLLHK